MEFLLLQANFFDGSRPNRDGEKIMGLQLKGVDQLQRTDGPGSKGHPIAKLWLPGEDGQLVWLRDVKPHPVPGMYRILKSDTFNGAGRVQAVITGVEYLGQPNAGSLPPVPPKEAPVK